MVNLFFGEEEYLVKYNSENAVKKANLQNPNMNYIKLDNKSIDKFIDNAEQLPFLDEKKVIYLKNTGLFMTTAKKISSILEENILNYLDNVPDYLEVIFVEESVDKRSGAYKKLSKIGKVNEYKYSTEKDLTGWVENILKKYNISMNKADIAYFIQICGPAMNSMMSELNKLIILALDGEKINREIIDDVCCRNIESVIFDLTDRIGEKKSKEAIKIINNLIMQKQAPQFIIIMIYKQIKNIYNVKLAMKENQPLEALGINPYVLRKTKEQASNYTTEELEGLINSFQELDGNIKIGNIDAVVGLERIILSLGR